MFTGIIEALGQVKEINGERMTFVAPDILTDVKLGDSIAVNGVCLTVSSFDSGSFAVSVMEETLKKTSLGKLAAGNNVNLERALKLGDRLGGHLVSGHVDGMGKISKIKKLAHSTLITITPPAELLPFIAPKGSITVDGVSLTVVDVTDEFAVSLVRHTSEHTNLGEKRVGGLVNLETDMLAKYIQRLLLAGDTVCEATSVEKLFKRGFIS